MEGECKVPLYDAVDSEAKRQATGSVKPSSKLTMALLALTFCLATTAAGVLLFGQHTKGQGRDENNFDLHHTLRQISNVRAAIHLEGEYTETMPTSVKWKLQLDKAHSQGGLTLNNNEIVIPKNGLYFVYSQASFRVSCSTSESDDPTSKPMVHLSHAVVCRSNSFGLGDDDDKTILSSVRTACQKSSDPNEGVGWYSALYMGAVFNLNKGDRLRTVTAAKLLPDLEDDTGKTYFGVFAL